MERAENLDGSRDSRWYREEASRLRQRAGTITHDPELRDSYIDLAREYEGLAEILENKRLTFG
jgi:hypothetical protein